MLLFASYRINKIDQKLVPNAVQMIRALIILEQVLKHYGQTNPVLRELVTKVERTVNAHMNLKVIRRCHGIEVLRKLIENCRRTIFINDPNDLLNCEYRPMATSKRNPPHATITVANSGGHVIPPAPMQDDVPFAYDSVEL